MRCRRSSRRGAALVEYLVLIGCVALVCAGAFRQFGVTIQRKMLGYGDRVAHLGVGVGVGVTVGVGVGEEVGSRGEVTARATDGAPGAVAVVDGEEPTGAAPVGADDAQEPTFSGLDPDAVYVTYPGTPFRTGADDASAVHPNDLAQGALADCYLIAALGAIATRDPAFLEELVVDNCDGTYTVTFEEPNPHDWWAVWEPNTRDVAITVTASFPSRDGAPVFAKPGDPSAVGAELWPMILEKAYAQYRGGYEAIGNRGFSSDVLEALTGEKSGGSFTRLVDFEEVYGQWKDGAVMTAGTLREEQAKEHPLYRDEFAGNAPLVAAHAYYVTAMDPVARTITLQNPWGWDADGITLGWEEYQQAFMQMDWVRVRR